MTSTMSTDRSHIATQKYIKIGISHIETRLLKCSRFFVDTNERIAAEKPIDTCVICGDSYIGDIVPPYAIIFRGKGYKSKKAWRKSSGNI